MGLKSHALLQGAIALALVAAWCFSVRADLRIADQNTDAESYCFQSQADGCWPQAAADAQRLAARMDDH